MHGRELVRRDGHVLIIVQNMSVPMDRRVWTECRALVAEGIDVSVICPRVGDDSAYEEIDGVRIWRYRAPRNANGLPSYAWEFAYCWIRALLLASRIFRRQRFDVIQACNPPDTYWALALLFRPFDVKFVYDQHDLCPELYLSRFGSERRGSRMLHRALLWLERATYRVAGHVISTNESYRRIALTRGQRPPDTVTVVRSGPRTDEMRQGAPKPDLKRGRKHLLVYLGIMGPQDGVDRALRAMKILVHDMNRDDVHAAFLGYGDCLDDLRRLAHELELDADVTFTGRADLPMIIDYLSTADIGLGPDPKLPLNDVSTMNKTMEYMAFGLPIVSFDLVETRYSAGRASVYVADDDVIQFAQALNELLDDAELRRSMGEFGRRRVEEVLAWEHQANVYVNVYARLLGRDARTLSSRDPVVSLVRDAHPH